MASHRRISCANQWTGWFFASLTIVAAIVTIGLQAWTMRMGLDISDEAFNYLLVTDVHTLINALRFQQFILWPVHQVFGGSVVGLRYAALIISTVLFGAIGLVATRITKVDVPVFVAVGFVVGAAASFGLDRSFFLRMPTYITVASWGSAIYLIGVVLLDTALRSEKMQQNLTHPTLAFSVLLIVVGAVVAGIARPPTGLVLVVGAFCLLILFVWHRALAWLPFAIFVGLISGLTCVLLLSLLGLTPMRFWMLWQTGFGLYAEFSEANPWLKGHIDDLGYLNRVRPDVTTTIYCTLGALLLALLSVFIPKGSYWNKLSWLVVLLQFGLTTYCFWRLSPFGLRDYYHLPTFAPEVGVAALAWLAFVTSVNTALQRRIPSLFLPALVAFLLPSAIVFGTGSTTYVQIVNSIAFFGISVLLITVSIRPSWFSAVAAFCVAGLALQVQFIGMDAPYRVHGAIWGNTAPVTLEGDGGTTLFMHPETAEAYLALQAGAREAGIADNVPLIDLTGRRPGMTLVLPTYAPVYPWIASGYPNSPNLLAFVWDNMEVEEKASAWLLGPLHESFVSNIIPSRFDELDQCYDRVATATEPRTGQMLELWKPKDNAHHRCVIR